MKIYYQWELWAYSHIVAQMIWKQLKLDDKNLVGLSSFWKVRDTIENDSIGILPIENSYAGSIHENMYRFLRYNYKVIWEIELDIRHCLLSKWKDIKKIKKVYSHPQALSQCYDFLKNHEMEPISFVDTASAAKMVSENTDETIAAIASKEASEIYWLNILKEDMQDQLGNTTRFFVIGTKDNKIDIGKKSNKTTIIFKSRNIPASLYKCLWAFATNWINLTKIESLPSLKDPFTYMFWLDFEWTSNDKKVENAINELKFFTKEYFIIWEY